MSNYLKFQGQFVLSSRKKPEKEFEMCDWFMVLWLYILLVAKIHQMPNISVLYSKFFSFLYTHSMIWLNSIRHILSYYINVGT